LPGEGTGQSVNPKFTKSRRIAVIPITLNIPFLSLYLAVALSADAGKAAQPTTAIVNQAVTKSRYAVYAAACSRSFRKVGSYDNLDEARRAARDHRKDQQAWIVTGNERGAWYLLPQCNEWLKIDGCSVYVVLCRSGMQLHTMTNTLKEAQTLAAQLEGGRTDVEIVYHLK
jgi:hypothetical protein